MNAIKNKQSASRQSNPDRSRELKIYKFLILLFPLSILTVVLSALLMPGDANIGLSALAFLAHLLALLASALLIGRGGRKEKKNGLIALVLLIVIPVIFVSIFNRIDEKLFCKDKVESGEPISRHSFERCQDFYPNHQFKIVD